MLVNCETSSYTLVDHIDWNASEPIARHCLRSLSSGMVIVRHTVKINRLLN